MADTNIKTQKRNRLKSKIRSKISGTAERPRLCVFKSNKFIYAQLIDDLSGKTIAGASDMKETGGTKTDRAVKVGAAIAEAAKKNNIGKVVFDRGGFRYAGRIKALADEARKAGLEF